MRAATLALALGIAGVVGSAAVVAGEDAKLIGKDAPPIDTKVFLQSDGRTAVADYKGELLFIECFATW